MTARIKKVVARCGYETYSDPSGPSLNVCGFAYNPLGSGQTTHERRMRENQPVMKSSNEIGSRDKVPETTPESVVDEKLVRPPQAPREVGGPKGLEPTRYGDWEKGGRCIDF